MSQLSHASGAAGVLSRPVADHERDRAVAFLRQHGYRRAIGDGDRFFVSELGGDLVAAVRLSREAGALILRGMRVRSDLQRRGVGTQLLAEVHAAIASQTCYCIAYRWLISFYAQAGFREATAKEVPRFLVRRYVRYLNEGHDAVLLCRRGSAP